MASLGTAAHPRSIARPDGRTVGRVASYGLSLAGIYLSLGFLFYFASKEKLIGDSGSMPAGLQKAFHGSFISSFPGDSAAWTILGILEALVVVGLVFSLARGEFLVQRTKPVLIGSLSLAMAVFGLMAFAENMIGDNATVSELWIYLVGSAALIFLVRMMPPYRSLGWLAGEAHTEHDASS
jgi:hypothetical protein